MFLVDHVQVLCIQRDVPFPQQERAKLNPIPESTLRDIKTDPRVNEGDD